MPTQAEQYNSAVSSNCERLATFSKQHKEEKQNRRIKWLIKPAQYVSHKEPQYEWSRWEDAILAECFSVFDIFLEMEDKGGGGERGIADTAARWHDERQSH